MIIFLETKRLILKPPEQSDLDNLLALRSEPEVMQYVGDGNIQTLEQVQEVLDTIIEYQKKHGFGFCSVYEKETGNFVGQAGLFHVGFDEKQQEIEVGYRLQKKFWGKGYATELTKAIIKWGFEHLPNMYLIGLTHPENKRSQHVLEKAGMIYTGKVTYHDANVFCYKIYKSDLIELVPYNTAWTKLAAQEIQMLNEKLPKQHIIDIQHVGSTAIPGIPSKPIIDIQIAVDSLLAIKEKMIAALETQQYVYWRDNPDTERLFFVKGMPPFGEKRTHHIHVYEPTSKHWLEKIAFRDYLIAHPEVAKKYADLKINLAREYTYDREQYTQAKTIFIHDVLKKLSK